MKNLDNVKEFCSDYVLPFIAALVLVAACLLWFFCLLALGHGDTRIFIYVVLWLPIIAGGVYNIYLIIRFIIEEIING